MGLDDLVMRALGEGKGLRRPSMPKGVCLVPTATRRRLLAILVTPGEQGRFSPWEATVEDLVAKDWELVAIRPADREAAYG